MSIINRLLALLCIFGCLFGCQKDYIVENSTDFLISDISSLTFKQEGGTRTITVTAASSSNWGVDENSYESWIKVIKEGNKIVITADKYDGIEERSTQLTVSLPDGKKDFIINQFGSEPVLRVEEGNTDFYFKKEQESKVIKIITNTDDWRVETFELTPWLKWERNTKEHTLTLNLAEFRKEDSGSTTNRKATLFLSSGSKHLQLNVIQKGWAQFGIPVFKFDQTRQEIIAAEEQRGHTRSKEYELQFYPRGQEQDKRFMCFSTDGEQTAHAVYEFNSDNLQKFANQAYLKAHEGKTFDMDDFQAWMDYNKYKKGRKNSQNPTQCKYYLEEEERTCMYHVYNDANGKFNGYDYPGAYMKYVETGNYMKIDEEKKWLAVFPVRNAVRLHDPTYKLKEVIAYEKAQGMEPDYSHELTKKCDYPNVEYTSLVFNQATVNTTRGELLYVIYLFNYPDAKNDQGTPAVDLSLDPALSGTVGKRQDVYQGNDYAYRVKPAYPQFPEWGNEYRLKSQVTYVAGQKGYEFVRTDNNGYTTYVRGEEELVDVQPTTSWVQFTFYRSKELVKLIR